MFKVRRSFYNNRYREVFLVHFRLIFIPVLILLFFVLTGPSALPGEKGWNVFFFKDKPASRFVSGRFYEGLLFAGTHSPGAVYSAELDHLGSGVKGILLPRPDDPAEAVLDFIVFQNTLYALVEKSPSEIRRWNGGTGVWEPVPIPTVEGIFFAQVFQNQLYVTGSSNKRIRVLRSSDGIRFEEVVTLEDWVWVPAVFREALYLFGHQGTPYSQGKATAYKTRDGSRYEPVPSLEGGAEYQCAYSWKENLYLGTGGWSNDRKATNTARIYRYDGMKRQEVLADIQMNGVTSLAACGRYLLALADSGWESSQGTSALYRTVDGINWERVKVFDHPEMRKIEIVEDKTLILLGGKNMEYGVIYKNTNDFCQAVSD
jgi:hypothetical protein